MSSGFSGSSTRGIGKVEREVETRLSRLDVFTDQFKEPDVTTAQDPNKDANNYQKAHDDQPAFSEPGFIRGAAAGNAKDQAEADAIDGAEGKAQARIKSVDQAFPMKKKLAGDNAAFDVHTTDPARLKAEVKKDMGRK